MELDCDARVVRTVGASYEYARVLLAVGERHAGSLPLAASLAGRRPFLERRITAMMMKKPRRPLVASLPFVALALVAVTAATRTPHPAPLRSVPPSQAAQAVQPFLTPEAIAAMLLARVPGLSDRRDSSTYGVLVLDANNNVVAAAAGYGNVIVQVWGDSLGTVNTERRSIEQTAFGFGSPSTSVASEGRARSGGAGGRGAGGGGGGRVAVSIPGEHDDIPPNAIRRGQWRVNVASLSMRVNGEMTSLEGPTGAYVAALEYERGPDPVTGAEGVTPVNVALGLHVPSFGGEDDSGIDSIPASALTSLETLHLGRDLIPRHDIQVMVMTMKPARAVR
jgi:hypothetical protein